MSEVVGQNHTRNDGPAKVTGRAVYAGDIESKGMLHAAILRSPTPAGKITMLNAAPAASAPGVRAVLTCKDAPDVLAGWAIHDTPLFARDEVRYEGEPIAAIAADTLEQARKALALIELEIEELPPISDLDDAVAPDARPIHPNLKQFAAIPGVVFNRNANAAVDRIFEEDNVDEAFENADRIIEDEFTFDRQYQAYLEPKACLASYRNGRFDIDTGHQYVFNIRDRVAQFLACRPSDVRVKGHVLGGGFGGKLDYGPEPYAALLSKAANGRPVKLVLSREEDMLVATSRENARIRIRSALDRAGNIIGREFFTDHDNGAYSGEMPLMAGLALNLPKGLYRTGPMRSRFRLLYTNTAPTGAFRGVSGVPMMTAVEWHMDHIADALGEDRRAFRLRHLMEPGDKLPNQQALPNLEIVRKGFDEIEKTACWEEFKKRQDPYEGVGIAATAWLTNPLPTAATIKLNEDGTAHVTSGTCDIGSGAMMQGVVQIVAQAIGIAPENVYINQPDTDIAAYDGGSQGSRTARVIGKAAMNAAAIIREKIFEEAAPLLQTKPEDLDLSDGFVIRRSNPANRVPLTDVLTMSAFGGGPLVAEGRHGEEPVKFDPGCANGLAFPAFPTPTYHVHAAKVAVDPVTGGVRVLRYIVAQEVGRALNPAAIMGQVQGGVAQGIGYTLFEGLRIDKARYLERSLEAYRLPLAGDVPTVEAIIMEHPDDTGPFGAKGAAEPPIILGPAVIGNAVADAIGVRIPKIPITPEDVLAALEAKNIAP